MTTSTSTTCTSRTSTESPSAGDPSAGSPGTESAWLYQRAGRRCWAVGYFDPAGQWQSESDHPNPEDAASRVHWLNGSHHHRRCPDAACVQALERAEAEVDRLEATVDRLSATATRWQLQARGRARRVSELQRRMGR